MASPVATVPETDHYGVLGLPFRRATADTINQAYRKLARKHHPDKGGDPEIFKAVKASYDVLKDDEERRAFRDEFQPWYTMREAAQEAERAEAEMMAAAAQAATEKILCLDELLAKYPMVYHSEDFILMPLQRIQKRLKQLESSARDKKTLRRHLRRQCVQAAAQEAARTEEERVAAEEKVAAAAQKEKEIQLCLEELRIKFPSDYAVERARLGLSLQRIQERLRYLGAREQDARELCLDQMRAKFPLAYQLEGHRLEGSSLERIQERLKTLAQAEKVTAAAHEVETRERYLEELKVSLNTATNKCKLALSEVVTLNALVRSSRQRVVPTVLVFVVLIIVALLLVGRNPAARRISLIM